MYKSGGSIEYQLHKQVRQKEGLRNAYCELAEKTFGLDFETWYHKGYWSDAHIPYTLFDGEKAIANVSVNPMEILWQGKTRSYIQLGTVMTDLAYRNQGLSRYLLEEVLRDWADNSDAVFLFANESVLDFYPKFGFERQVQYQYSKAWNAFSGTAVKLDIEQTQDLALLQKCYEKGNPFSALQAVNGFELLMFYCGSFYKDCIYYVKEQDAVVIVEKEERMLYCLEIFCDMGKDLEAIISAVADEECNQVVFQFTPKEQTKCQVEKVQDGDDALFVLKGRENIFEGQKLLIPVMSHT